MTCKPVVRLPHVHEAGVVAGREDVGGRWRRRCGPSRRPWRRTSQRSSAHERAAEPAARLGLGEADKLDARHGAERAQRPVAHVQYAQRVARVVVGDAGAGQLGADDARGRARPRGARNSFVRAGGRRWRLTGQGGLSGALGGHRLLAAWPQPRYWATAAARLPTSVAGR